MLILALESSCDECSIALLEGERDLKANLVASQIELHAKYGGVVPEIACRRHLEVLNPLLQEALETAGVSFSELDAVAVSHRPGLIGAVLIGVGAAKVLAGVLNKPLIGVNHLEGHIYANFLAHHSIKFPLLALVVSGGHTNLLYMPEHCRYRLLGETRDDAAGEAFDKTAKFLGLGYPGGAVIEKLAKTGTPGRVKLPRPLAGEDSLEFSFSGLKTAVINFVRRNQGEVTLEDVCRGFQDAVVGSLTEKTLLALEKQPVKNFLLAGGVAANSALRENLKQQIEARGVKFFCPPLSLCTDNAAMIACAAHYLLEREKTSDLSLDAYASLPPFE